MAFYKHILDNLNFEVLSKLQYDDKRIMYIGGFKPVKNSKDRLKRLSILIFSFVFIYSINQCEQSELNKPIDI